MANDETNFLNESKNLNQDCLNDKTKDKLYNRDTLQTNRAKQAGGFYCFTHIYA